MTEHSRDCVSLWGADLTCDCATAKWEHLRERLALAEALAAAVPEMLGGHFNLYKSVFGEDADPDNDLVRVQLEGAWRAFVGSNKE